MPSPTPTPINLKVDISASLRTTNGTMVEISGRTVCIRKPGPQGGAGQAVDIALSDWSIVNDAVERVRAAIVDANQAIADRADSKA